MSVPVVFHPSYEVDIGPHVFPTAKYRLVRERALEERLVSQADLVRSEPAATEEILLVHTTEWVEKLKTGALSARERFTLEVPWSPELVEASWLCAGGTTLAARLAREGAVAVHLGGGFHHAFAGHGEGFCAINDVAVAIRVLQRSREIESALVIDLDVHQGNGTAAIFAGDPGVFTFSVHEEANYPFPKPPSDLDVGLARGTPDGEYLELLRAHLPAILEGFEPDVAFYLAGADPYREDQLGGLGLTIEGLRRRDDEVFAYLADAGVPVAACLAGGYARRTQDTVEIHLGTLRAAAARARAGMGGRSRGPG